MSNALEQSYFSISRYFDAWVRLVEIRTRRMEVEDSVHLQGTRKLIVSPPTDAGIPLLLRSGRACRTELLCLSDRLKQIASIYSEKHGLKDRLHICVAPFFRLPFFRGEFAAIYANCFFDFCPEEDFAPIFAEMHRVLEANGSLFAVYMGHPDDLPARGWALAFKKLRFLSQGCRPVSLEPYLLRHGFTIRKSLRLAGLGFPLRYTLAEKRPDPA